MRVVLVESTPDPASVGIAVALRGRPGWTKDARRFEDRPVWVRSDDPDVALVTTETLHIRAEGLDARLRDAGLDPEVVVFLSKHRSESARPTLTVHPVGNFRAADLGGEPGRLTPVPGAASTHMLRCLDAARRQRSFPAEVSFEVTHHGPLLGVPAFFVELGSSDAEWKSPDGHAVLADAVERFLATVPEEAPLVVGLGGGHYAPRFTEAALTKRVHFAHLVPTYHASEIEDPAPLALELRRASPGATGFYYHDGTLPKPVREKWFRALADAGLPQRESKEWLSRSPPIML